MAWLGDQDDAPDDCELDIQIDCPRCGCNATEVIQWPKDPASWWGRYGRARCVHCSVTFAITIEEEGEEEP